MLDLECFRRLLPTTALSISEADLDALLTQMMTIAHVGLEPFNLNGGTNRSEMESRATPKRKRNRKSRSLSFRELLMAVPQRDREKVIERAKMLECDGGLDRKVSEDIALSEWGQRKLGELNRDSD